MEFISAPAVTLRNLVFKLFPMPPKPRSVVEAEIAGDSAAMLCSCWVLRSSVAGIVWASHCTC